MNVKELTTAAVLSSIFIISSLIFIGFGLGYLGYIDFVIPVFIGIILLKCNIKYSVLASITSLLLTIFLLGNLSAAVMMTQSMILGIVIGIAIEKGRGIYDDIFFCSIIACLIIVIFDINFSFLTGYSLLEECSQYLQYVPSDLKYINYTVFYITISVLPVGTVILCYLLTLILGKKLRILNKSARIKAGIILGYKKYSGLIACSRRVVYLNIFLVIFFVILNKVAFVQNHMYLKIICNCELYIIIFFVLQDSFMIINKYIFFKTKSPLKVWILYIVILWMLLIYFKITSVLVVGMSLLLENKYKIKTREENILSKVADNFL